MHQRRSIPSIKRALVKALPKVSFGLLALYNINLPRALAQSTARIPERVTIDGSSPGIEDLVLYLAQIENPTLEKRPGKAQTVRSIEKLLGGKVEAATKLKLMTRLAELHRTRADEERSIALSRYREAYATWLGSGGEGEAPKLDDAQARKTFMRAIETYRRLLTEFDGKGDRRPTKLALGVLLARVDHENADLYLRDAADGPANDLAVRTAKLALAERRFAVRNLSEAGNLLKSVVGKHNDELSAYARYRLGFVTLGTAEAKASEAQVRETAALWTGFADEARKDAMKLNQKAVVFLAQEARKDLVRLWAIRHVDGDAKATFTRLRHEDDYARTLERSGYEDAARGDIPGAIKAYEAVRAGFPRRADAYLIDARLAGLYDLQGATSRVVALLTAMNQAYAQGKVQKEGLPRILTIKLMLMKGNAYYERASKSAQREPLLAAVTLLDLFVKAVPKGAASYEARFRLGDAMERAGMIDAAARTFYDVARLDERDARHRIEASTRMLRLQQRVVAGEPQGSLAPAGSLEKPQTMPPGRAFLVKVIDAYLGYLPKDPKAAALSLQVARLQFDYGYYPDAVERFDRVSRIAPQSPEGEAAVDQILSYFVGRRDWDKAITWSQGFLARGEFSQALVPRITARLRTGLWEKAQLLESQGKGADASRAYLVFQTRFPMDPEADLAVSRAAALDFKDGRAAASIKSAELLIETYPRSNYRASAFWLMGDAFESTVRFDEAAVALQRLAADYPKDPRAMPALRRAADLFTAADNRDNAAQCLQLLAARYAQDPGAASALLDQAKLLDQSNETARAIQAYTNFLSLHGKTHVNEAMYARVRLAILAEQGSTSTSETIAKVQTALAAMPPNQGAPARDELALHLIEGLRAATEQYFGGEALEGDGTEAFDRVRKKIDEIAKHFAALAAVHNSSRGAEAQVAFGEMYSAAAKLVRHAPKPAGVTADEAFRVESEKEKLALALEQSAQTAYKAAVQETTPRGMRWRGIALQKLARLMPGQYAALDEKTVEPRYIEHTIKVGSDN